MSNPTQNYNTIMLKGHPEREEALAGATIIPGMLLERHSDGKYYPHSTLGGSNTHIFAAENEVFGNDINTAYSSGDNVLAWVTDSDDRIYAAVQIGQTAIVAGDYLESNGDGTLVTTAASNGVKASVVTPTVTNGTLTFTAKQAGASGNELEVVLAAAGSASVVVAGSVITITPATGSNTGTAILAQLAANATAAAMISAVCSGTGAGQPTAGSYQLSGGVDAQGAKGIAQALEACDNSTGSTIAHVAVAVF